VGTIQTFRPEKLICGVLTSRVELIDPVISKLTISFGPVDYRSREIPFDFTPYYDDEMGTPIVRLFLAFDTLLQPDRLAECKVKTNQIEDEFSEGNRRRVNLDPGLISLKRLILASTKDNGRRIPLSDGIYAEITLIYVEGSFQPVPWTYPDYRSDFYLDAMKEIRDIFRAQLKQIQP
jgi:hypothetical protein